MASAASDDAPTLYDALSHPPVREAGNEPDVTVYRTPREAAIRQLPLRSSS